MGRWGQGRAVWGRTECATLADCWRVLLGRGDISRIVGVWAQCQIIFLVDEGARAAVRDGWRQLCLLLAPRRGRRRDGRARVNVDVAFGWRCWQGGLGGHRRAHLGRSDRRTIRLWRGRCHFDWWSRHLTILCFFLTKGINQLETSKKGLTKVAIVLICVWILCASSGWTLRNERKDANPWSRMVIAKGVTHLNQSMSDALKSTCTLPDSGWNLLQCEAGALKGQVFRAEVVETGGGEYRRHKTQWANVH